MIRCLKILAGSGMNITAAAMKRSANFRPTNFSLVSGFACLWNCCRKSGKKSSKQSGRSGPMNGALTAGMRLPFVQMK